MSDEKRADRKASRSATEPTIREILRSEPSLTPLESYDRAFAFLGAAEPSLTEEEKKQQYLTKYRLYVTLKQGALLFVTSLFCCILYFIVVKWDPYNAQILGFLNAVPPGNIAVERFQLNGGDWPSLLTRDSNRFLIFVNSLRFIWTAWLTYRVVKGFIGPGEFFSTRSIPNQYYLPEKMIAITAFSALLGTLLVGISYHGLFERKSIFAPSVFDAPVVFTLKSAAIMSLGYWILGLTLFLITTLIRQIWSQLRG